MTELKLMPLKIGSPSLRSPTRRTKADLNENMPDGIKNLLAMNLSPMTPQPGEYKCSICWESSKDKSLFISPCKCVNENLRFSHIKCINDWVNETKQTSCSVCTHTYNLEYTPIPLGEIVSKNHAVFFSFFVQLLIPILVYVVLFVNGMLQKLNLWFVILHVLMLCTLFVLYAQQVFRGLVTHRKSIKMGALYNQ